MSRTTLPATFLLALLLPTLLAPASRVAAPEPAVTAAPREPVGPPSLLDSPELKTRSVFIVMMDGTRWQEVFTGAEEALITKEAGKVENVPALRARYWRDTPEERRALLMPFLWNTIAVHGQVFGNQHRQSIAQVANSRRVSYPGYSETLTGVADERIRDNRAIPNPNVNVLEWLENRPGFEKRTAAFATWNLFPWIFNVERTQLMLVCDTQPVTQGRLTPELELLNRLRVETPSRWNGNVFDSLIFHTALQWTRANEPRVLFLGFGEPDEWGHECDYEKYLDSIQRCDAYLAELWSMIQSSPVYRDATSLVILPDHGRGDFAASPTDWANHNADTPGAENIWLAVIGPDTPALGERAACGRITQSQVAATVAALLGEDFCAAFPAAAPPIADVIASGQLPSRP